MTVRPSIPLVPPTHTGVFRMSATVSFAALQVAITLIGIDGLPKAAPAIRPLRKTPTGFGVVYHGKVIPVTPTSANTGTAKLTDARLDPALCPVAKKTDLGAAKPQAVAYAKAPSATKPEGLSAQAPAAEGGKKPRTLAQLRATANMCAANLAKATAKGDPKKIEAALRASATADAKVADAMKPAAKPAKSRKGTKASVTLSPGAVAAMDAAEAHAKAKAMPTKAELMAQIEALTAMLAAAK